ncbi:MAG: hypothetical protein WHS86_04490 [Desulfosoma sp.]
MATRAHGPRDRDPQDKKFLYILFVVLLLLTTGALFLLMKTGKRPFAPEVPPSEKPENLARVPKDVGPEQVRRPVPTPEPAPQPAPPPLAASPPPYPDVPPQASQDQRKEAFGLKSSVDHVVQSREPFNAHGRQWTVEEIQRRLAGRAGQGPSRTAEPNTLGDFVRKPAPGESTQGEQKRPTLYYGVRSVRPGENLWRIHYGVVREYFARRGIELPNRADQPRADGRSSGVGRILKFLEGIVYVYNTRENRLVEDLDLLYPNDLIVFFKISEVFQALDQVNAEELDAVRYLGPTLQVKAPSKSRVLLNQKDLKDQPPPPVPEKGR